MRLGFGGVLLLVCAVTAGAQSPPAPPAARGAPAGLETDWDIGAILLEMSAHASRLAPVLDKVDVKSWIEKGASETYQAQWQSSKDQTRAIADGAKALSQNPERLAAGLELFFRIEGLETMLGTLEEGIRQYQTPALAQELAGLEAENGVNRGRFQRYIVELAAQREQEYNVMDREAQRCRSMVFSAQPPKTSGKKK
jgi:hypothetical protein